MFDSPHHKVAATNISYRNFYNLSSANPLHSPPTHCSLSSVPMIFVFTYKPESYYLLKLMNRKTIL